MRNIFHGFPICSSFSESRQNLGDAAAVPAQIPGRAATSLACSSLSESRQNLEDALAVPLLVPGLPAVSLSSSGPLKVRC
jgi:hypothetical protein